MKKKAIMLALAYPLATLFVSPPVAAGNLDADGVRKVVLDRTWAQKKRAGPGENYWQWKADGSVCLRLFKKTGRCDDAGLWTLEANRICYDLGWWGVPDKRWAASGKRRCFLIYQPTAGRYELADENKIRMFEFSLLD